MSVSEIKRKLVDLFTEFGMEVHPFLIGWYNNQVLTDYCPKVSEKFLLPHSENTLAFVVISQPSMFEKSFLPFLEKDTDHINESQDPLDTCMIQLFQKAKSCLPDHEIESLHDFQLHANRRPKILVQTAGHVAGAVRFYQQKTKPADGKKLFPVCMHPEFGGWFALRGVLIFSQVEEPHLEKIEPPNILSDDEAENLLQLYNHHWQDWRWRDCVKPREKYSTNQMKYFETKPGERSEFIRTVLNLNS